MTTSKHELERHKTDAGTKEDFTVAIELLLQTPTFTSNS